MVDFPRKPVLIIITSFKIKSWVALNGYDIKYHALSLLRRPLQDI